MFAISQYLNEHLINNTTHTKKMRLPRVTLDAGDCAYHCISRVVSKEFLFNTPKRKDHIVKIMLASEILFGANILNYVVMDNHIHALVQMRSILNRDVLDKKTILKLAKTLYSSDYVTSLQQEFDRAEKADRMQGGSDKWHTQQILNRYEKRRGCLSNFMKELKERIAHYINKEHKRSGTLWDGRFKSAIVENTIESLAAVSAYIDLNPIRAGIVKHPQHYRWCGYSAALQGDKSAQEGLAQLYAYRGGGKKPKWKHIKEDYRLYLYERGLATIEDPDSAVTSRLGFTAEQLEQEIARNGKIPAGEILLHRVRYFSDGAIIGTANYVDAIFKSNRDKLTSPTSQRNTGARTMRGADWGALCCLRDLSRHFIGQPN